MHALCLGWKNIKTSEVVPPRNRRDVAIFNRHRFACRLELVLQFRPAMSARCVEPKNSISMPEAARRRGGFPAALALE